jgi:GNAT superfamily N-acetyltransferase
MTTLPEGFEVAHTFSPGDLGELIRMHGIQNFADYGFNVVHEACCARIAAEFIIGSNLPRSRAWLVKKETRVVGSILIIERDDNLAQLRLLFVDRSVRGAGVGRWLVEESVRYSRDAGFRGVYLWTVEGLDRAIRMYEAVGFRRTSESVSEGWGRKSVEVRFDLTLGESVKRSGVEPLGGPRLLL